MRTSTIITLPMLIGWFSAPTLASELQLGGKLIEFANDYNRAAQELDVNIMLEPGVCNKMPVYTCEFIWGDILTIVGSAADDGETLRDIAMQFRLGSRPTEISKAAGLTLAMYAPQLDADERGAAFGQIFRPVVIDGQEEAQMTVNDVQWTMRAPEAAGVTVSIEKISSDSTRGHNP